MIAIISSSSRERAALITLCESRGWPVTGCDSVRAAARQLQRSQPRTIVVRHLLHDGFSDHVLARLPHAGRAGPTRVVVLVTAGTPSALEARQITLGADCVMRDPIRTDVLLAHLTRYQADAPVTPTPPPPDPSSPVAFAGGVLHRSSREFRKAGRAVILTPREVELIDLLVFTPGEVVTYDTLYSEILNRLFHGETSNMRVLLGKLVASTALVGVALRDWVRVIPKSGYVYRPPTSTSLGMDSTPANRSFSTRAARRDRSKHYS